MAVSRTKASLQRRLLRFFRRNAYVREPHPARQLEGPQNYRKGWELRLILRDLDEVAIVERILRQLGFNPGRPYPKHSRWVVPVYGQAIIDSLREWEAKFPEDG